MGWVKRGINHGNAAAAAATDSPWRPLCIMSRTELKCVLLLIYVPPTGRSTKAFTGAARCSMAQGKDGKVYGTIDYNFTVVSSVVLCPLMKYAPQQLQTEEEGAELLWLGRLRNIKSDATWKPRTWFCTGVTYCHPVTVLLQFDSLTLITLPLPLIYCCLFPRLFWARLVNHISFLKGKWTVTDVRS